MNEINDVGQIIVSRKLTLVHDDGSEEDFLINIGLPVQTDSDDFCCPYELVSINTNKVFGMVGIDTFQALSLTMKTLAAELEYIERKYKGKFHFLGEEGHCC